MRAFLYTGGVIHPAFITEHPTGDDLTIAVDCGYRNAKATGTEPAIVVGDFDSFPDGEPEDVLPKTTEILRVPAEKDATDTQLAVGLALERGADEIVIIGGLGGRLDHALSNISLLEDLHASGVHATITDGQSRVRYIRSTSYLLARSQFKYLSLITADETVKGVTLEGCKYSLKNAKLSRRFQYAISNEIEGNCALITVKKGGLYIIESHDVG